MFEKQYKEKDVNRRLLNFHLERKMTSILKILELLKKKKVFVKNLLHKGYESTSKGNYSIIEMDR